MKTSCKLALFSDTESAHEGTSSSLAPFDYTTGSTEVMLELGRSLYKLMFQLLLLIESNHKIAISVQANLQQNEQMHDLSASFSVVRDALLRCIDDAEMDSLDTSTSTEGEITPTPSPGLPMSYGEFEKTLYELIDTRKWSAAISLVKQHKKMSSLSSLNINLLFGSSNQLSVSGHSDQSQNSSGGGGVGAGATSTTGIDDLSFILNAYAQRMLRDQSGMLFVLFLLIL